MKDPENTFNPNYAKPQIPKGLMTFYHGTSEENWKKIQEEGVLYGRRYIVDNEGKIIQEVSRCTYLAVEKPEAECYGDVILEVKYDPSNSEHNNYCEGCWQVRVYEPIPLENVKRIL